MSVPTRLLVASVSIISFAALAPFRRLASSPRSGILHLTKECSQYTGEAGSFCTITSSNLNAIPVGTKDVAVDAAGADGSLDLTWSSTPGVPTRHSVISSFAGHAKSARSPSTAGQAQFKKFHANLVLYCPIGGIAHDGRVDACRLDGPYSFDTKQEGARGSPIWTPPPRPRTWRGSTYVSPFVSQVAAKYSDNAPLATTCGNACRTCVQTNCSALLWLRWQALDFLRGAPFGVSAPSARRSDRRTATYSGEVCADTKTQTCASFCFERLLERREDVLPLRKGTLLGQHRDSTDLPDLHGSHQ